VFTKKDQDKKQEQKQKHLDRKKYFILTTKLFVIFVEKKKKLRHVL
jgi:hypothetical protein